MARFHRDRLIFGPFAPIHAQELRALEDELGCLLPPAYRAFIQVANGGTLQYDVRVPPNSDGEVIGFSELGRLGRDGPGEYGGETLLGEYRRLSGHQFAEHVPAGSLLPIARDGGGSTLFLDLSPDSHGRVLAFVHGLPAWAGPVAQDQFGVLAEDFDTYLDNLFIDSDTAEILWEDVADADPGDPWRRTVEQWLDQDLPRWRDRSWAAT